MGDRRTWNRRCFTKSGIDPKDGERTYKIVSFKFKKKSFARPVLLTNKMASDWYIKKLKELGWEEGKEW